MRRSEADAPSKAAKPSAEQEKQEPPAESSSPVPVATVYPEWPGFQAYSPIPPHGYSPAASSPQGHPYMWGTQEVNAETSQLIGKRCKGKQKLSIRVNMPVMPPYGTPPPPYVMYPPGGLYAHPSMPPGSHPYNPYAVPSPIGNPEGSGAAQGGAEADGKSSEGKERSPIKRSKGSLGSLNMITGKTSNDLGKTSGASANEADSQSGESGSEGSSGSDASSQNDSQPKACGREDPLEEASKNGSTARGSHNGLAQEVLHQTKPMMSMQVAGAPGAVTGPTTNLNIGMDYWGTPTPSMTIHGKVPASTVAGTLVPVGMPESRESMPSEHWLQDERELKRQKRKQSNRESARRSRLRKQAECEELAQRLDTLKEQNTSLRDEADRIRKAREQLLAQNASLKERLGGTGDTGAAQTDQDSDDDAPKHIESGP